MLAIAFLPQGPVAEPGRGWQHIGHGGFGQSLPWLPLPRSSLECQDPHQPAEVAVIPCSICGGIEFGFGPGGRLSVTGQKPYCITCGSLERHRAVRSIFLNLRDNTFDSARALQFSNDPSIDHSWFRKVEMSIYGGENSLDLMRIDRDSASYDIVICNHVLEHVQYDNAAMVELLRIVAPLGFLFLTFPDPARCEQTIEFAAADPQRYDHWRLYGRDVVERFRRYLPGAWVLSHNAEDPVTGAADVAYLLTREAVTADQLRRRLPRVEIACSPAGRYR
jgi:SAM-dependent methyltransferase